MASEKLSNADRNRLLARSLFVDANKGFKQIAETLGVSDKTIGNYQSKDKAFEIFIKNIFKTTVLTFKNYIFR